MGGKGGKVLAAYLKAICKKCKVQNLHNAVIAKNATSATIANFATLET